MNKVFISAQQLLEDSFKLAVQVYESGFRPDYIVGVWRGGYGNWELSSDRANAARRVLIAGGYDDEQVARVVGYASSALFDRENPLNPVNRRIDIVVLTKKAQRAIEGEQSDATADEAPAVPGAAPVAPSAAESAAPGDPLPDGQLRERLNIFEEGVLQFDQPAE